MEKTLKIKVHEQKKKYFRKYFNMRPCSIWKTLQMSGSTSWARDQEEGTSSKCPHCSTQSRSNATPAKISVAHFTELEQTLQNLIRNHRGPHMARAILGKQHELGGITIPSIKLHYRSTVTQKPGTGMKTDTQTDQRNG